MTQTHDGREAKATLPSRTSTVLKAVLEALSNGKLTFQHCRKCSNNWLPARASARNASKRTGPGMMLGQSKMIKMGGIPELPSAFEDRCPILGRRRIAEGRAETNMYREDEKLVIETRRLGAQEKGQGRMSVSNRRKQETEE